MKMIKTLSLAAAFTLAAASSALAGDHGYIDVSRLNGMAVWDFHGKKIGDIQQVLLDTKSGRARFAVVQVDKEWSLDNPEIAVPWGSMHVKWTDEKPVVSMDATKEKLMGAPGYKLGDADRLYTKEASEPIYSYWSIVWHEDPITPDPSNTTNKSDREGTSTNSTTPTAPNTPTPNTPDTTSPGTTKQP